MDRRKQYGLVLAALSLPACLASAQDASPSPMIAATPRPTPVATAKPAATPAAIKPPTPAAAVDEITAARRADRKERQKEIEEFLDAKGGDATLKKLLDRLPPDVDREAFRKNLLRWRDLPLEERDALRGQVDNRGELIKAEIDKTVRDSGLNLNADQREVFALRYMQERRKLERSLRDQMGAERARRLPGIVEQLKKEFSSAATPTASPLPKGPTATPSPTPPVG